MITSRLTSTIGKVTTVAQTLATGDLQQAVDYQSEDELGQMADAFRSMITYQQALASVAKAMAAQVEEMTAQAEELAATAEQLRVLVAHFQVGDTSTETDAPQRMTARNESRGRAGTLRAV